MKYILQMNQQYLFNLNATMRVKNDLFFKKTVLN
jgi:hypothetical protein